MWIQMSYYINRVLDINLPEKKSAFLWGARKTGKSTFLKNKFPQAINYDLLKSDLFLRLAKSPSILREELLASMDSISERLVIIDEIQKIPALLDEIHWLIENTDYHFILCGSSARKLKRYSVNMLGGRAWKFGFFPLVFIEIKDWDLLRIMQRGALPSHYDSNSIHKDLKSYIEDYLIIEIQSEGLVRNLPAFARFMDAMRFTHGQMVNYSNIARQAGIDSKTVKEYFNILIDTLVGYYIYPYKKKVGREIISDTPKFYFFDVGVANKICKRNIEELSGSDAGQSLEHYILLEIIAYKHIKDLEFDISYWRTKSGYEVDFILGDGEVALEVKISKQVHKTELKPLIAFIKEHATKKNYVISNEVSARKILYGKLEINIIPVKEFLILLWQGKIL